MGLGHRQEGGQGLPSVQGSLWLAAGITRLEREVGRHAEGDGLPPERARRWGSGHTVLLVGVYVDDLIITGTEEEVKKFKAQMKKFDMSDLRLLCFYLSVKVRQDASGITLRQAHFAKWILELVGCNPTHTPMEEKLWLSRESMAVEVDSTHYW